MPYTKEQLENGKSVFYNSIREDLRNNYLDVLSGSASGDGKRHHCLPESHRGEGSFKTTGNPRAASMIGRNKGIT